MWFFRPNHRQWQGFWLAGLINGSCPSTPDLLYSQLLFMKSCKSRTQILKASHSHLGTCIPSLGSPIERPPTECSVEALQSTFALLVLSLLLLFYSLFHKVAGVFDSRHLDSGVDSLVCADLLDPYWMSFFEGKMFSGRTSTRFYFLLSLSKQMNKGSIIVLSLAYCPNWIVWHLVAQYTGFPQIQFFFLLTFSVFILFWFPLDAIVGQ